MKLLIALPLAGMLLAACGDDERTASFTYIYTVILEPSCGTIGCHSTRQQTFGNVFDDFDAAYTRFTGGNCDDGPGAQGLIVPGDATRGTFFDVLRAEDVNKRMPPDRPLPVADIELIERWVNEGALCN